MRQCIKDAAACREETGRLRIHIEAGDSASLSLYRIESPYSGTQAKTLIRTGLTDSFVIDDPLPGRRSYFLLEGEGSRPFVFAERLLKVPGLNNFRDCGGYPGADGRRVKWGLLYRSDHLCSIPPQTVEYIKALEIRSIIDYRGENEIRQRSNVSVGEKKTFHFDPSAHTAELAAQFAALPADENRALIDHIRASIPREKINGRGEQVLEQYRNFVNSDKSKNAFRGMLSVILDRNNAPNIQHCRGGKDRTGYGTLLVLAMLGVSKTDIIQDYMLTRENRVTRNAEKMAQYRALTDDQAILEYLFSLIDTREYFIEEAFSAMEKAAGSAEQYIKQELGFTEKDFRLMRENYLEP
jgi:protein-tyrosine phosphatase